MFAALDVLNFVLGTRPPDDISRPSCYLLLVAALRSLYACIFEIDD
jgi:hypothetical protein